MDEETIVPATEEVVAPAEAPAETSAPVEAPAEGGEEASA